MSFLSQPEWGAVLGVVAIFALLAVTHLLNLRIGE